MIDHGRDANGSDGTKEAKKKLQVIGWIFYSSDGSASRIFKMVALLGYRGCTARKEKRGQNGRDILREKAQMQDDSPPMEGPNGPIRDSSGTERCTRPWPWPIAKP